MKVLVVAVTAIVAVVVVALATLLIGLRFRIVPIVDGVRRFNKAVTNRRVRHTAGAAGAPRALVRHVGRRSGKRYETPVDAFPTDTGYLIALPYGTRADWLRNVLAAGSATVLTDGTAVPVAHPEIVPTATVADRLPKASRLMLTVFDVESCLSLRRTA